MIFDYALLPSCEDSAVLFLLWSWSAQVRRIARAFRTPTR